LSSTRQLHDKCRPEKMLLWDSRSWVLFTLSLLAGRAINAEVSPHLSGDMECAKSFSGIHRQFLDRSMLSSGSLLLPQRQITRASGMPSASSSGE